MSINNKVELTGNIGKQGVRIIDSTSKSFASFSMATTESYKDSNTGKWMAKNTIWHKLVVFNPNIIEAIKGLTSKDRIKVTSSLDYLPIEGSKYKKEASLVVTKIEDASLR